MLEPRNLKIGHEVGTDQKGPYLGSASLIFVDKASGYGITHTIKVGKQFQDSKDAKIHHKVSGLIERTAKTYEFYDHHIQVLKSDAHSIYTNPTTKAKCLELKITQDISPPGQHELNGLAEIYVQVYSKKVAAE